MREIRPIGDLGNRVQEAGRIRMGIKTGPKGLPKAIDTWRFTSGHKDCIEQLAEIYGGEPKPWSDAKAAVQGQWEVITTAKAVRVLVPPGGLSQFYELWSGARCERRCDGETATIPSRGPDGHQDVPCQCNLAQAMDCKPYTRLSVVLPDIVFRGTWRLESKSWNAADELPAMERMIDSIQETKDIVEAELVVEKRSRMTGEGKRNFVVPVLNLTTTAEALAAGESGIRAIGDPGRLVEAQMALEAGVPVDVVKEELDRTRPTVSSPDETTPDDEVVDAELVYEPAEVKVEVIHLANDLIMDTDAFGKGVARGVSEGRTIDIDNLTEPERTKAMDFMADVRADRIVINGVGDDGRLRIVRKSR